MNMKKILLFALLCVLTVFQAQAVLKEKDLLQMHTMLSLDLEV